jgi:DNA-binding cell septation regulator SpoVG
MKVTSVKIFDHPPHVLNDPLKAYAEIIFDGVFVVKDLKIVTVDGKTFVAMPSKRNNSTGENHDIAHPITKECRKMIEDAVLAVYRSNGNGACR